MCISENYYTKYFLYLFPVQADLFVKSLYLNIGKTSIIRQYFDTHLRLFIKFSYFAGQLFAFHGVLGGIEPSSAAYGAF